MLEQHDIEEIIRTHVKSTNLLNLGSTDFGIDIEANDDGESVALIDTNITAMATPTTTDAPKQKRTRRNRAQIDADNEEANQKEPDSEEVAETEPETETETKPEEAVSEPDVVEEDPPFDPDVTEPKKEVKNSKSLFA
jgi:outer membrane biosynthesis protein TonB